MTFKSFLTAYTALFGYLVRLGLPRQVITALWWLGGMPILFQIALKRDTYGLKPPN